MSVLPSLIIARVFSVSDERYVLEACTLSNSVQRLAETVSAFSMERVGHVPLMGRSRTKHARSNSSCS